MKNSLVFHAVMPVSEADVWLLLDSEKSWEFWKLILKFHWLIGLFIEYENVWKHENPQVNFWITVESSKFQIECCHQVDWS
jgi:hypothetical protein